MGDEPLNPVLPAKRLAQVTGDRLQGDVETAALYREALEKFEIFHIAIDDRDDCYSHYRADIRKSFGRLLKNRFRVSTLDSLPRTILDCLRESGVCRQELREEQRGKAAEVSWSTDSGCAGTEAGSAEGTPVINGGANPGIDGWAAPGIDKGANPGIDAGTATGIDGGANPGINGGLTPGKGGEFAPGKDGKFRRAFSLFSGMGTLRW